MSEAGLSCGAPEIPPLTLPFAVGSVLSIAGLALGNDSSIPQMALGAWVAIALSGSP